MRPNATIDTVVERSLALPPDGTRKIGAVVEAACGHRNLGLGWVQAMHAQRGTAAPSDGVARVLRDAGLGARIPGRTNCAVEPPIAIGVAAGRRVWTRDADCAPAVAASQAGL